MKQLRKKYIIIGLILICTIMERASCAGFKVKYKQDRKKDSQWPYNLAHSSRNKDSAPITSIDISGSLSPRTIWDNPNNTPFDINTQHMQIDNQPLDLSNPIKSSHNIDSNAASSSNIKEVFYMDTNDIEDDEDKLVIDITSELKVEKTIDITSEKNMVKIIDLTPELKLGKTIDLISHHTTSTNINCINVETATNSVITSELPLYNLENHYNIRNFTSCIENVENIILSTAKNSLTSEKIDNAVINTIKNWRSDPETDIWTMIKNMDIDFLFLKHLFKGMVETKTSYVYSLPNPFYYDGFLDDLVEYIENHGSTIDEYIGYIYTNRKKETLGDIWLNKEISLYCCCSGINSQMVAEGKGKDAKLKKKLNIILLIPEVYEDFYRITLKQVNIFFSKYKKETINMANRTNNIVDQENNLEIKDLLGFKYIITYLIHTTQKDEELAEEAYNKIKQIKFSGKNDKSIEDFNAIEVYHLVYNAVSFFYKYIEVAYRIEIDQRDIIKNRTRLIHINTAMQTPENSIVVGASTVKSQKYFKCCMKIKKINIEKNSEIKYRSIAMDPTSIKLVTKNSILLAVEDHYHVQFVDNEWHTITMIHLPYYIHRQENCTTINYQFHTIKDIIFYIQEQVNKRKYKNKKKVINVYAFKYNRQNKTWSLITKRSDLNRTVHTIENENCNVVFYYIKEDIYKTKFCFAQFVYSSEVKNNVKDDNMDKTRIPLFLPMHMVYGCVLGPYDKNSINYNAIVRKEYKDLKPTDYEEIYIPLLFNSKLHFFNSQKGKLMSSMLMRHMKESDLNYAIKHYYSDFFIRNSTDFYEDPQCYCMNIQQKIDNATGDINITWNTRFYESVYEYTIYKFNRKMQDERSHLGSIIQPAHASFIDMLQRKNPSMNTALYGHCFYKSYVDIDYKTSSVFCLTMKDLLERMNAYLVDINTKDEIIDPISGTILNKKDYDPKFILKDISNAIKNSKLQEIRQSGEGIISIRDNNYNGCKYGIHYDIINALVKISRISLELRLEQLKKHQETLNKPTK
ncbi:hypothetical protein NEIRO03_1009 [Nematocida sp. AWRm78]|nr:hypothetical protein NEIRO02_1105 [Nematocida sp. AWRm79]KAI5183413.1 hypothetical protein NEIRO03_1009 [Nematocida sp. AWRm78]